MRRIGYLAFGLMLTASLFGQAGGATATNDAFTLTKVGYVMLGVADVPRAVEFYHGKLGLKLQNQDADLAFIDGGTISIVVSSEAGREPGESEVVFPVDHVKQAVMALTRQGIRFDVVPHPLTATNWAASFKDPDGHVLTVFGPQ